MPKRSFDEVDQHLRRDPDFEAALEELAPFEALARRLIEFRIEKGLSQSQLAGLCGTRQPAIARLESGEHVPTLETLQKVAHALGADLVLEFEFEGEREEVAVL